MTFRRPQYNSKAIGRQLQFFDPTKHSNKKYFWGQHKNQGFYTTQQIALLQKKKQLQKKKIIYCNDQYQIYQPQKNNQFRTSAYKYNSRENHDRYVEQNMANSRFAIKKRIHSQMKDYESPSIYSSYKDIASYDQNRKLPSPKIIENNQNSMRDHRKINSREKSRRLRTLPSENIQYERGASRQYQNPQAYNQERYNNERINPLKKQNPQNINIQHPNHNNNYHNNLDSGNIKISIQPPQQERISPNMNYNREIKQIQRQMNQNYSLAPLKLNAKQLIRTKLRRDHSPTFCNSINYPLRCFRYV